ncbi:MAG: YitT family protein [Clostridiaceae bacterium]
MDSHLRKEITDYVLCILGGIIYAVGISFFVFPMGLFIGNITGIAQIIQDLIKSVFGTGAEFTGVILLMLNLPLLLLSYKVINRKFFVKTVLTVTAQSFAMASFPILKAPLLNDPLTLCIIGGVIAGFGAGFSLRYGGSGGGLDVLGVFISLKYKNFSVGKVSILVSSIVFVFALLKYDISILIYSIIFTLVYSLVLDAVHFQNVKVSALIVTKNPAIGQYINDTVKRGVTTWKGQGVYSGNDSYIIFTVVNKYEFHNLKRVLNEMDPDIFIVDWGKINVTGNFKTQLFD